MSDDSVKTQDHTLAIYTKRFHSCDSKKLTCDQMWLQIKTNMKADCRCQLVALICPKKYENCGWISQPCPVTFVLWAAIFQLYRNTQHPVGDASRSDHSHWLPGSNRQHPRNCWEVQIRPKICSIILQYGASINPHVRKKVHLLQLKTSQD